MVVAEAGGVSSQRRSLAGSACGCGGEVVVNGEAPLARIEGGTKDAGSACGISVPESFFWIKYIATANPSLVSFPSLLMSARSLAW